MSSRSRFAAFVVLVVFAAASGARADTVLDLSNTASVTAPPDEIAASLRAETTAETPEAAQEAVNRMMESGLASAHRVQGVTATTGQYSVWLAETPPPNAPRAAPTGQVWHASQSLELTGHDGTPMLTLVGALQADGMGVQSLDWRLSPPAERTARDAALHKAIAGLRARAEEAAGLLGLRFASFRTVRLNAEPGAMPMPIRMRAFAATAPSVEQGPIEVTATVSAEAVLVAGP